MGTKKSKFERKTKNMKKLILLYVLVFCGAVFAAQNVAIDENGNILPAAADMAIRSAVSAALRVDLATAKAEGVRQIAAVCDQALEVLNEALRHRTDYALVQITATGLEDAVESLSTDGGEIVFIEDKDLGYVIEIDRGSVTTDVTLYYCFTGNLTTPKIQAKSQLSGEWLEIVDQTDPEVITVGEKKIYKTIVKIPNSWGAQAAFFQATAEIKTAVDDGKVFDIFSDTGVTGTFYVKPSSEIYFRLQAGRVINISGSGIVQKD